MIARLATMLHARLVFGRRVDAIAAHVASLLPPLTGSMLDLGCGDGTLARSVAERFPNLEVEGLEISARPATAIPVRVYDGGRLPYADASHDVVLMVDMLHHADDPHLLLAEAARVARRAVMVKDDLRDPWLGSARLAAMDWVGNIGHGVRLKNSYWARDEWNAAFAGAGLKEQARRETLGLYPLGSRWLFESGLHFVARLGHAAAGR